MSFLSLYRDPIVAANTEYSEFKISDLVNHERPVSLYLVVPMASRDRLRPLIRLILNQIVRTLTTTLAYKDGRAVSANRHPLLLMLDEFPMLGRIEVLAEALSLIAGYGIRACLVAQDSNPDLCGLRTRRSSHHQLRYDRRVCAQQDRDRAKRSPS